MRRVLLLLVGTAVFWLPAVSVAGDSSPGPSTLAAKSGTPDAKSNMSNPASTCQNQHSEPNFAASHNGQTFTQFYATNLGKGRGAGANAFGKCVSTIANHQDKSDAKPSAKSHGEDSAESHGKGSAKSHGNDSAKSHGKDGANPAMTCKAMQANDLAHFQTTYGTRPNAFGKCVAKQANGKS